MRSLVVLAASVALSGCGSTACNGRSVTYELVPSDPDYFISKSYFDYANESPDWECSFQDNIRNALGAKIGERWLCVACD